MSHYEAYYPAVDFGWRGEFVARLRDILARKAVPARAALVSRFSRFVRRLDGSTQWKRAVVDMLQTLRSERAAEIPGRLDRELEVLDARIRAYRGRESIENYSEFLFVVDLRL